MGRDPRRTSYESVRGAQFCSDDRVRAGWQGLALVVAGWSGVGLAHAAAWLSGDPASAGAVLSTAGVAVVSLVAIGGGAAIAVTAAVSPTRHVFHSRPAFRTAAVLLVVAAVNVELLIVRAPFDDILGHGKPLAELIGDLTCVAASLICLVAGGVALREAWKARRNERSWGRSRQDRRAI
ncbi:MAG: hypothetical protein OEU32_07515 [Acidimicrobiia bacterium]|nr:hypothetical protein [Acidimicrobiia bacterium]